MKSFILAFIFLGSFFILTKNAQAAAKTWDGGGADNNWSTAANWSGDTVPATTDSVTFNGTSTKNCTVNNVGTWSNGDFTIISGYGAGVITASTAMAIKNFSQAGGTFKAGANSHTVSGNFSNTSGTFTKNTSTFTFTGSGATIGGASNAITNFSNVTINPGSGNTIYINSSQSTNGGNLNVSSGTMNINGSSVSFIFGAAAAKSVTIASNASISGTGTFGMESFSFLGSAYPDISLTNNGTINVANVQYDFNNYWGGTGATIVIKDATNGAITFGDNSVATNVKLIGYLNQSSNSGDWIYNLGGNVTIKGNLNFENSGDGTDTLPGLKLDTKGYNLTIGGNFTIGDNDNVNTKAYTFTGSGGNLDINGNLTIQKGSAETVTFTAPSGTGASAFTLAGNYSNTGTFTHNSGTLNLDGSAKQTLSGTMTGTSAFNNLTITNNSGTSATNFERTSFVPSVDFDAAASVGNNYTLATNHTRVEYNSGSTYTLNNISFSGGTGADMLYFRNSAETGTWLMNVSGTQAVSNVNVSRSNASGGSEITATNGTNYDANNNTNWNFGSGGSLSFDMVDGSGNSVLSPAINFASKTFSWSAQQSTGTLGSASQKMRVANSRNTKNWTLSIAATDGAGALWSNGTNTYDFNDTAANGRLQVDPSVGTITAQSGCPTDALSKGTVAYFSQGVTDSIPLLSANTSAYTNCYWDFTGVALTQDIPASQKGGNYSISMTLTAS